MHNNEEQELKKEFQLERVILFSDAVFAIIITIMVLDIRLPEELRHADSEKVSHAFLELIPKFVAYGLSFFLVARFWLRHLQIFSVLKDYDSKLLGYNLLHLFSVSLFPFAVSLISGNVSVKAIQYAWGANTYISIFLFSSLSQTLLTKYLMDHQQKLCFYTDLDKILKYKLLRTNFFLVPGMVVIMVGLSFAQLPPYFAMYALAFYGVSIARLRKKYYPENDSSAPFILRLFQSRQNRAIKRAENKERISTKS